MSAADPIARFLETYARASQSESFDASRAAFATADAHGIPSVRFVLVKDVSAEGFVVYTHVDSQKGRELAENPVAALSFHWASIGEQVRVSGAVTRVSDAEADRYFASRPRGSQLGAWASAQSRPIASRDALTGALAEVELRFAGRDVPRPAHWTGFRVRPERVEFWEDRPDRLHVRTLYVRSAAGYDATLLSP